MVDRELVEDGVEVWTMFWRARRIVERASDEGVLDVVEPALHALILSGVRFGKIDDESGRFELWSDEGLAARVVAAIRNLGREPHMGDIGWLVRDVYP